MDVRVDAVPPKVPVQPQPILAPLTPAAIFVVVTIDEGGEATVHDALPDLSGLVRAVGFRDPIKHLSVVASIGSEAWDRLFAGPRPAELHPFVELEGPRQAAPATPGDLLFHIRAETMDVCFELAGRILKSMAGAVTVVDEVHGFRVATLHPKHAVRWAGQGLSSSRRHYPNVPSPLRRGILHGCTFRIFTASMAFTLSFQARHSLAPPDTGQII
jgi:Dyp-type peroxidase, N-terminal